MIYEPSEKDLLLGDIIAAMGGLGRDGAPPVERWCVDAEPNAILFDKDGLTFRAGLNGHVEQTDGRLSTTSSTSRAYESAIQACLSRRRYEETGPAARFGR